MMSGDSRYMEAVLEGDPGLAGADIFPEISDHEEVVEPSRKRELVEVVTSQTMEHFGDELEDIAGRCATYANLRIGILGRIIGAELDTREDEKQEILEYLTDVVGAAIERGVVVGYKLGEAEERERQQND